MNAPVIIDVTPDTVPAVTAQTYGETIEAIAAAGERYAVLTADTPDGYEAVRLAIADCRTHRTAIEATRKELKAGPLEWGRRIDAVAKDLISRLEAIEQPLKDKKATVDEEKARARAEKAAAERAAVEAQILAQRAEEEERQRVEREAESQRMAAERAALAEERARLDAERAEADHLAKIERDRLAEETAKVRAAQAEIDRQTREREAEERAKAQAEEVARRVEAERQRAEEERAAHLARLEALKPDALRLRDYATALLAVPEPEVVADAARLALATAQAALDALTGILMRFGR